MKFRLVFHKTYKTDPICGVIDWSENMSIWRSYFMRLFIWRVHFEKYVGKDIAL
jgi:hypothetical protein